MEEDGGGLGTQGGVLLFAVAAADLAIERVARALGGFSSSLQLQAQRWQRR
jgi:hypothetical protein